MIAAAATTTPAREIRLTPRRTIFGFIDPKVSAPEFVAVETLYCGRNRRRVGKLNKSESTWSTGCTIIREKNLDKFPYLRKKGFQLALCGLKVQIPNKNFVSDDGLLSSHVHVDSERRGPIAASLPATLSI